LGAAADDSAEFTRRGSLFAKADNPFVLFNAPGRSAALAVGRM
jgi:hypothetical protein